jgi:hypothetical protein
VVLLTGSEQQILGFAKDDRQKNKSKDDVRAKAKAGTT